MRLASEMEGQGLKAGPRRQSLRGKVPVIAYPVSPREWCVLTQAGISGGRDVG